MDRLCLKMKINMPYNRPIRQQYAVIGDGPVESLYFESIKNEFRDSLSNCTLRPEIPKHTNVEELERLIQKCISLDYDMIICIIDMVLTGASLPRRCGTYIYITEINNSSGIIYP